jgi:thioredoxin-dependent peroxiredoxin
MKLLSWILPLSTALLGMTSGTPAPNFSAKNQDGKVIQLTELRGKFVLLFFYPKDDTPGCTKEVCNLRDNFTQIKALNTVVLGISRQDEKSHQAFIAKHKLPFDLLVDSDGAIAKSFGVGTIPLIGFHKRQSILIAPDGTVVKFYSSVDPDTHAQEVLADIKVAQAAKK